MSQLHLSVQLAILSVVAFIAGIILELLGELVRSAVGYAILAAVIVGFALFGIACIITIFTSWWPVGLISLSVITFFSYRRRTNVAKELLQKCINFTFILADLASPFWEFGATAVRPPRRRERDFIADQVDYAMQSNPSMLSEFCQTLNIHYLRYAYEAVKNHLQNLEMETGTRPPEDLKRLISRYWIDESCRQALRNYLEESIRAHPVLRKEVLLRAIDISKLQKVVDDAYATSTVLMRRDASTLYEDHDRHQAEGELRTGLALPVGVLTASIIVPFLSDKSWLVLAAIPAVVLYIAGIRKRGEAANIVYTCIENELQSINKDYIRDPKLISWRRDSRALEIPAAVQFVLRLASRLRPRRRSDDDGDSRL